jgi:CysZ protein
MDFFRGLTLPFLALRVVFGNRRVFLLSLIASVVTFFALLALVALLALYTDDLVRRWFFEPSTWYGQVGFWALVALLFVLLLVVGLNTVPLLLLAPLQDPLSEATEQACGTSGGGGAFSLGGVLRGAWVSIAHTAARIALLLGGHALLLPLHLVPGVGSALWAALSITWTIYWLAAEYLDAAMARQLYPFSEVRRAVLRRLPLCMGFGAAVYLLMWLPVLNLFFVPLAVVAGTLLFHELRREGSIGPPPNAP